MFLESSFESSLCASEFSVRPLRYAFLLRVSFLLSRALRVLLRQKNINVGFNMKFWNKGINETGQLMSEKVPVSSKVHEVKCLLTFCVIDLKFSLNSSLFFLYCLIQFCVGVFFIGRK